MVSTLVIRRAPSDVLEIAEDIRADFHAELAEAGILWLVSNAKRTKDGNVRLGVAKKLSPEAKFLSSGADSIEAGYDFIITISEPHWNSLLAPQRKALLDHELCHCGRRERENKRTGRITYSWVRRGHDLEEFIEVVERHGLWNKPAQKFGAAAGVQLPLPAAERKPRRRKTTVDQAGVVASTQLEQEPSIEPDAESDALRGELDEILSEDAAPTNGNVVNWHDVTGIGKGSERVGRRSRDEQLADLDARDEALSETGA